MSVLPTQFLLPSSSHSVNIFAGKGWNIYIYIFFFFFSVRSTNYMVILKTHPCFSDRISHSVMSNSLRPHESQHARPPCPSPTPGVHSDSHPSSQWCHPAISSSVIPFSTCPQFLPASESFPVSQLLAFKKHILVGHGIMRVKLLSPVRLFATP